MKDNIKGFLYPVLFSLIISLPIIYPYFHSGFFPTHDGEWAVVRLADMFRSIKDLQFPVRYSGALNFGYGYPLFNFTYPLPYYLGILLYPLARSFVITIKIEFVLSVILSGITMYYASKQLWGSKAAGYISTILYIYLPYRMVDLYVRGSLGESLSFVIFPCMFYIGLKLFTTSKKSLYVALLAITIAALVMMHNIMTILFLPLFGSFFFVRIFFEKRWDVAVLVCSALLLGAGISAFFWIPALLEKHDIALSLIPIAKRSLYFVQLKQLIIPTWGFAPPTEHGGFSYQLGIGQILALLFVLILTIVGYTKKKKSYAIHCVSILLVLSVCYFLMMFSFTQKIWETIPLLQEINYPWTMLSQLGFLTALLGGFAAWYSKRSLYVASGIAIITVFLVIPYAQPSSLVDRGDQFYLTNEATTTSSDELMPIWVKTKPSSHFVDKVEAVSGSPVITDVRYTSKRISFTAHATAPSEFAINTIFYPGWEAESNGNKLPITYTGKKGIMHIRMDTGTHVVGLFFRETTQRTIADLISLLTIGIIGMLFIRVGFNMVRRKYE